MALKEVRKIILTTDPELIESGVQEISVKDLEQLHQCKYCASDGNCYKPQTQKEPNNAEKINQLLVLALRLPNEDLKTLVDSLVSRLPNDNFQPGEESHICKYCGVETTQPDDVCYKKPEEELHGWDKVAQSDSEHQDELWGNIFAKIKQYGINGEVLSILKQNYSISENNL